ncbi:MAG: DsrE/DsrF/DrsH-like family protein [Xanthobacteraceae bacterium]|mgnify:FL=1
MTAPPIGDERQQTGPEPREEAARPASRRLLIVLMNTDPRNVAELGAPFYHAAIAAAMDYEVDVLCTAAAGTLMHKGVAEKLFVKPGDPKTVYDWIREAHEHGARFWACPANLELFDVSEADLIPECRGMMGAAAMIQDIMDGECRVLTY